jgi:cutinase
MAMTLLVVTAAAACATAPLPRAAGCPDVEVIFARGTNQPAGLGRVGQPFVHAMVSGLPGRTVRSYPVDYPADSGQHFEPGATDIIRRLTAVTTACPATRFVLGGYSQGALAVSAAIGVRVGGMTPPAIPAAVGARVAAVVVFGNPLGSRARSLESSDTPFRRRSKEFCNQGDVVCGGRGPEVGSHRDYPANGTTDQAAAFAIQQLSS